MIYVNQKQLEQVEYLIEQSSRGYHILFDNDTLRKVFHERKFSIENENDKETPEEKKEQENVEKHIEKLILQPTLVSKKAYLENLKPEMFIKVVRTYFSIVENNIFESQKFTQ